MTLRGVQHSGLHEVGDLVLRALCGEDPRALRRHAAAADAADRGQHQEVPRARPAVRAEAGEGEPAAC